MIDVKFNIESAVLTGLSTCLHNYNYLHSKNSYLISYVFYINYSFTYV